MVPSYVMRSLSIQWLERAREKTMRPEVLKVNHISYKKSETILSEVTFSVFRGEILGIIGINGVGKSTLAKILSGALPCDSGTIQLFGNEVQKTSKSVMEKHGVSMIGEELNIFPNMSVADNLFVGKTNDYRVFLSKKHKYREAERLMAYYRFPIDVHKQAGDLSYNQKKIVQIVRQLSGNPKILIVDDLSELLQGEQLDNMFRIFKDIVAQQNTVIYLSHRYKFTASISDRVLVMLDGVCIAEYEKKQFDLQTFAQMLDGGKTRNYCAGIEKNKLNHENVLRIENLSGEFVKNISFDLKKGEILGITGLLSSEKTELLEIISGKCPLYLGNIFIDNKKTRFLSPRDAMKKKVSLCYEDIRRKMLVSSMSVKDNISLNYLDRICRLNIIRPKREKLLVSEFCKQFDVESTLKKTIFELNNASLLKISIIKSVFNSAKIIILDEPLRALDAKGRSDLQYILSKLRKNCGIIIAFSNYENSFNLFDKILVMNKGKAIAQLRGDMISSGNIQKVLEKSDLYD